MGINTLHGACDGIAVRIGYQKQIYLNKVLVYHGDYGADYSLVDANRKSRQEDKVFENQHFRAQASYFHELFKL
ncbi:hypothetical protein [Brucella rhizosphaerae]|uniref:hypothetical protein n=1 Tax=Brucella rhizosphaerae TaxID=571254 RepID=UPI000B98CEF9|nr:hypothetical protein [Brucella rhizosphaerae]